MERALSATTSSPATRTRRRVSLAPGEVPRLRLSELPDKQHLAGAGNWLYRIPWRDGQAVLKVYTGNRLPLLHVKKSFGNLLLTGRTSHMPRARCRTERDCLELWERHGFRCFGVYPEAVVEDLPDDTYLLFDHEPGVTLRTYFRDGSLPVAERLATWRRWLPEWHRRHRVAVELGEPRLIHENGDLKHVMLRDGDFVSFDLEICYRSRDVRNLVGRELLAYLRSVRKALPPEMHEPMLDAVADHYPDKTLLLEAWLHAFRNRSLLVRAGRALECAGKRALATPTSKYAVAVDLKRRLDARALNL